MATLQTIGGAGALFVGEDKTLRLELLDTALVPIDMAAWTMLFDVRTTDNASDPALLSKTPSVSGAYNAVRATNTQRAFVTLTDVDLNTLKARTYRYSWKRMDADNETVLAWGDFTLQKATAP